MIHQAQLRTSVTQHPVWMTALLVGFAFSSSGFAQNKGSKHQLKTVEWPGLGETTAVCVRKNGWYVCVLPEGASTDKQFRVFNSQGKEVPSKLLHSDPSNGICLIESETGGAPHSVPLSSGTEIKPGLALMSLLPAAAALQTRVAGKDREYLGKELPSPRLRVRMAADTQLKPGTPLVNEEGELEALIADRKLSSPNEAHAIPVGLIRKVINDVENHQKSGPVWVGMRFQSDSSTPQVVEVKEDSPAEKAGILPHDVILEVGGNQIGELGDLVETMKLLPGEEAISFKVLRDLEEVELVVVPKFVD